MFWKWCLIVCFIIWLLVVMINVVCLRNRRRWMVLSVDMVVLGRYLFKLFIKIMSVIFIFCNVFLKFCLSVFIFFGGVVICLGVIKFFVFFDIFFVIFFVFWMLDWLIFLLVKFLLVLISLLINLIGGNFSLSEIVVFVDILIVWN